MPLTGPRFILPTKEGHTEDRSNTENDQKEDIHAVTILTLILLLAAVFGALRPSHRRLPAGAAWTASRARTWATASTELPAGPQPRRRDFHLQYPSSPRCGGKGGAAPDGRGWCWAVWESSRSAGVPPIWEDSPSAHPREAGSTVGSGALVDCDDVHCLMIALSGVGKTAYFLYLTLSDACASGMSFSRDTKGDLASGTTAP